MNINVEIEIEIKTKFQIYFLPFTGTILEHNYIISVVNILENRRREAISTFKNCIKYNHVVLASFH